MLLDYTNHSPKWQLFAMNRTFYTIQNQLILTKIKNISFNKFYCFYLENILFRSTLDVSADRYYLKEK